MTNPAITESTEDSATNKQKRHKGWLSKSFSFVAAAGAGAAVTMAVKSCAIATLCTVGAPATVSTIVACATAGLVVGTLKSLWKFYKNKKENPEEKLFTSKNIMSIGIHAGLSAATGSLTLFFGDAISGYVSNLLDFGGKETVSDTASTIIQDNVETPPAPVQEVIVEDVIEINPPELIIEPEVPELPERTTTEQFLQDMASQASDLSALNAQLDNFVETNNITDSRVLDIVERAQSGDAQALKDMAALLNTKGSILDISIPKDPALVMSLYEAAIGLGNDQAIVDYAFIQHYGHNGIPMDKEAAIALLQHITESEDSSSRLREIATCFHEQWTEGFDGRNCAAGTDCVPEVVEAPEPAEQDVASLTPAYNIPAHVDVPDAGCTSVIDNNDMVLLCGQNSGVDLQVGEKISVRFAAP